jgi:hypothetical protein
MKYFYKTMVATLLLLSMNTVVTTAQAQQPPAPSGMTEEQHEQYLKDVQDHILVMHDLSNKILLEKDPAKQEELKKQQRELMKSYHEGMMEKHARK